MTLPQNDFTSERLHLRMTTSEWLQLRMTPPQNDYLRMTPTQNDSNSEWLQLRTTLPQNDSNSEWLYLRTTPPQNDSTSEWLYLRMTSVQPLVMSTNTNSRWLSRAAQARCPGFDSQQLPAFSLSPISFAYFVSKSLDSSVRQEFKVPQIGKFSRSFFFFCVRNVCSFNFRHLSNWRKIFNGENFPIYSITLTAFFTHTYAWSAT